MTKCKNGGCPKGKEICCFGCEELEGCKNNGACDLIPGTDFQGICPDAIHEGTDLQVFQSQFATVIKGISDLVTQKKQIEDKESTMREQLQKAMEQHGIKQFDSEIIKVTYMEASTRNSIDSAKLKKDLPDIAAQYSKTSAVKAFVKIEVK